MSVVVIDHHTDPPDRRTPREQRRLVFNVTAGELRLIKRAVAAHRGLEGSSRGGSQRPRCSAVDCICMEVMQGPLQATARMGWRARVGAAHHQYWLRPHPQQRATIESAIAYAQTLIHADSQGEAFAFVCRAYIQFLRWQDREARRFRELRPDARSPLPATNGGTCYEAGSRPLTRPWPPMRPRPTSYVVGHSRRSYAL